MSEKCEHEFVTNDLIDDFQCRKCFGRYKRLFFGLSPNPTKEL